MPIGNPRWLPPQVIVLTQDHIGKIQKYLSAAKKDTFEVTEVEMKGAKVFFLKNEAGIDLETQIIPDTEVHIYT
jgi:hypothetical protein